MPTSLRDDHYCVGLLGCSFFPQWGPNRHRVFEYPCQLPFREGRGALGVGLELTLGIGLEMPLNNLRSSPQFTRKFTRRISPTERELR